jgi:hypothetical protein
LQICRLFYILAGEINILIVALLMKLSFERL